MKYIALILIMACMGCESVELKTNKASIEIDGNKAEVEGLDLKTKKSKAIKPE